MLNYMPDVQQRGQRWKLNSTFSTRALWHCVEWCRAFGTLALWSMARRDWGKVKQCICWPCRPLYAVAELLDSCANMCVYIYMYIYKAIQAWWEDISVSSSNIKHFCHYTASCPFSNHITSISLLAKRLNNGETHSHLHNVRSTTLVATFSMTLQQTLALARQGPNARLQVICCEFPNL